ncbi:hypothetical protein H7F31_07280 [Paenibacillus sp. PAMC21692]|nr:hypothetical protein H7F31_07280 [Paenibacillus sp. PAMC21692]
MNELPSGATDLFERAYRHLLEETREVLPDTKLVLCEPFILEVGTLADNWVGWSRKLSDYREIVRQLSGEFGTVHVPLQAAFDRAASQTDAAYWLWDGVHPTAAGHALIAGEWLAAVKLF